LFDSQLSIGGVTTLQTGARESMTNARLIEIKFAFDAPSRFVGETVICIRARDRDALNLDQVQLEAASFRDRIIFIGLVCRDHQLRAPI
jgi:hypothetical protein